mmetsp:Transcript_52689/g.119023  ORF Transcript_52689/g.119023 Transcript_52689/m.119023 type:complete len:89 (+) Transcript_52689:1-267(+)
MLRVAGPAAQVRYLQVHPAEPTGELIPAMPLAEGGFLPQVITFGKEGGDTARRVLESHGYHVCCCVERGGSNMVATLGPPPARAPEDP